MLVNASGIVTAGAPAGKVTVFKAALAGIATAKHNLTGGQLFIRAVLCNMLVCLALWMAARAASDGAKLIVLWWGLLAFISAGFEHSIANMTSLSLAALVGVGTWGDLTRNLVYTVPGNLVGGGLFVGLAYGWLGSPTSPRTARLSRPAPSVPWTEDDLEDDEAELVAPAAAARAPGRRHQARPEAPQGRSDRRRPEGVGRHRPPSGRQPRPDQRPIPMTGPTEAVPMDDRKAALVAAGLVAAVVLVLGFGSGIFSVLSRDAGSSSSARVGRDLGTDVQGGTVQLGTTSGGGGQGLQPISAVTDGGRRPPRAWRCRRRRPAAAGTATTAGTTSSSASVPSIGPGSATGGPRQRPRRRLRHDDAARARARARSRPRSTRSWSTSTRPTSRPARASRSARSSRSTSTSRPTPSSSRRSSSPSSTRSWPPCRRCPPFWTHVQKGHLEASPAQQVHDITATDQYVKTHTVLVEDMLAPVMAALIRHGLRRLTCRTAGSPWRRGG